MKLKNIIILTTGSSGSSVLAGTIASKGYWLGDDTKKLKFDTYENAELVDLDIELLKLSGFHRYDCNDIPPPSTSRLSSLANHPDLDPKYEAFISKSNTHAPWLWKDPRLSYTIHFWSKFLDLKNIHFIFIERDPRQSYAGLILKRKVPMSYAEHNRMNESYKKSCMIFFQKYNIPYMQLTFEKFLVQPENVLESISKHINNKISVYDLQTIYKGKLNKERWKTSDFYKAICLYHIYKYIRKDYIKFPRKN